MDLSEGKLLMKYISKFLRKGLVKISKEEANTMVLNAINEYYKSVGRI